MKTARIFSFILALSSLPTLRAVYAPVPDQDLGKPLTLSLVGSVRHDSNIFGSANKAISSGVYTAAPKIAFNSSLTEQTFFAAFYQLTVDNYDNRPGDKTLDSHDLYARLAHSFSSATTIDIYDEYQITRDPTSLLSGVPVNTDQSYKGNAFDVRFDTSVTEKTGLTFKFRDLSYHYNSAALAADVDRNQYLYGVAGSYTLVPEIKLVGEYRHQDISYDNDGASKDKQSDFVIGGFDYNIAKKLTSTTRFGYTWRHRDAERSATIPYAEISAKYDYGVMSYFTAGYVYTFEEVTNVAKYTDSKINRIFLNVQNAISAFVIASGSITYAPSQLQGRRGISPNMDETTTRLGFALTWLPGKNWAVSLTYDHDRIASDDLTRNQERTRTGASLRYTF